MLLKIKQQSVILWNIVQGQIDLLVTARGPNVRVIKGVDQKPNTSTTCVDSHPYTHHTY